MATYGMVMMGDHIPKLDVVVPDGKVRPPVIALVGPENSGKTTEIVKFSRDERLGTMFALEWGAGDKGVIREYAAMEGARIWLLNHNNTVEGVFGQLLAAREVAREAAANGKPLHPLAIDSFSTPWELIKMWTYRRSAVGMQIKAAHNEETINPNVSVNVGRDLWNDARSRYRQLMTLILSWPAPVILTARADWVSGTDDNGRPTKVREYQIECHKSFKSDVTGIIRMNVGAPRQLTKLRSHRFPVDPQKDPVELPNLDLGDLIFDKMGFRPDNMTVPDTSEPLDDIPEAATSTETVIGRGDGPRAVPRDWDAERKQNAGNFDELRKLWRAAKVAGVHQHVLKRIQDDADAALATAEAAKNGATAGAAQ